MHFSLFESDYGLGDLADTRVVVLRGSTTPSQLFSPNFFDIGGYIETALEIAGFSVNAVRTSAGPQWFGYAQTVEIEINLYNRHTSEEARVNAIRAIEAYTANFGLNKVFSNTTLSVTYDAYVPPSSGSSGTGSTPKSNTPKTGGPPSTYDTSQMPAGPGNSQFLDNLGLGLGVSTPVVIGAGALLLVLMLRR